MAVSGLASTPFNVAVGGTDFDQFGRESQFWDTTATSIVTLPIPSSAKSYIPEVPWNDSCAQNGLTGCRTGYLLDIIAGSGGVSTIYAKPSWQVGKGVPNNSHRNLPDVSLFAGNGFNESFYIICAGNLTPGNNCNLTSFQYTFQGVGGTSVSAPAFAGIMALVNQKQASGQNPAPRQGNANYFLYALAQQQNTANLACNSSSAPAAGCNFNDTTKGNNAVPCTGGSTNCSTLTGQGTGVLVPTAGSTTPAYTTTAGYDLATGLGSVNAQNLVNKWASVNTTASTTTLTLNGGAAVNVTHGQPIAFSIAVSPGSANGDTSLIAVPNAGLPVGVGPFPLVSGVASGTTKALPGGGSYNVRAHYEGNGTAAPSDSAPVAVTIAPEASKLTVTIPVFDPSTGQETGKSPTTLVYGSPYILRADVTNAGGSICAAPACPTGTVTFTDTVGGVTQGAPNSGTFALNIAGYTENLPVQFPGGSNLITATYSGDSSFAASTQPTTYTLVVTPAPTRMSDPYVPTYPVPVGTPTTISAFLITDLRQGAAPGGTIAFFDGATPIPGTVTLTPRAGDSSLDASISGKLTETFTSSGIHTLTAQYSGDGSYAAATSNALDALVLWPTTMALSKTFENVNYGDSVTVTATVTTPGKTPPITGQFNFSPGPTGVTPTLTTDASGNQTLTATATITPTASIVIQVGYSGDGNYERASENDFINLIVPDFTMTSAPAALTMTAGQQSTVTYTVAPMTSKSSTVELNCTFPALWGVTCAITPASVNLTSGAPASAILTLSAQGSSAAATAAVVRKRSVIGPFFVAQWPWSGGLVAVALIILLLPGRLRRHSLATALGAAVVIVAAFGCGGGES
ncbi:MAG: Ig-like domain repeat protein [Acidobacteriota bacterium]|nr:Ig-like domain repeat protein [Acidobacteriota bacterium]